MQEIYYLIGRPLQTVDAPHQTIGKGVGLAVFASDALSSTAYATQEILVILAAAGTVAFGYVFRNHCLITLTKFFPADRPMRRLLLWYRISFRGKRSAKTLPMQTAEMLRRELLSTPGVVITEVPYQIH